MSVYSYNWSTDLINTPTTLRPWVARPQRTCNTGTSLFHGSNYSSRRDTVQGAVDIVIPKLTVLGNTTVPLHVFPRVRWVLPYILHYPTCPRVYFITTVRKEVHTIFLKKDVTIYRFYGYKISVESTVWKTLSKHPYIAVGMRKWNTVNAC